MYLSRQQRLLCKRNSWLSTGTVALSQLHQSIGAGATVVNNSFNANSNSSSGYNSRSLIMSTSNNNIRGLGLHRQRPFSGRMNQRYFSSTVTPPPTDSINSDTAAAVVTTTDTATGIIDTATVAASSLSADAVTAVAAAADVPLPDPNFVIGGMMHIIDQVHVLAGMPYFAAIIATTIAMRICLLPIAVKTIQGSARMATLRPDMMKIQERMKSAEMNDPTVQSLYQQQMAALFKKHQVNPFYAFFWPISQFPIFIASFLALKDMGLYYPALATGGALWFVDLTAADPYLLLPLLNSVSFLAMIELGSDGVQMEQQQQQTFKMVMRGLAVVMVPLTMNMPQAVFIYWSTNNALSLLQTAVVKQPAVKKMLNIPDAPKPEDTPLLKIKSPFKALNEALARQRAQGDSAKAEIIEGKAVPGPPSSPHPATTATAKLSTLPPRKNKNRTK